MTFRGGGLSVPSYIIFDKYIHKQIDGSYDVSQLLSKACFDDWLSSRPNPVRNPSEAFRKTLTSHCQGTRGMRPFDEDVEPYILNLLRQPGRWPCFEGTPIKVGTRGTRAHGYHEKKRKRELGLAYTELQSLSITKNTKQLPSTSASATQQLVQPSTASLRGETKTQQAFINNVSTGNSFACTENQNSQPPMLQNNTDTVLQQLVSTSSNSMGIHVPFYLSNLLRLNETIYAPKDFLECKAPEPKQEISDLALAKQQIIEASAFPKFAQMYPDFCCMLKAFVQHFSDLEMMQFATTFCKTNEQELLAALNHQIHQKTAYFFSREFCLPSKEFQRFDINKPIGIKICDTATFQYSYADDCCNEIYRGSVVGLHSSQLKVHKLQCVTLLNEIMCKLSTVYKHEIWKRSVEYRQDGTVMVLLKQCLGNFSKAGAFICRMQDITEAYQEYV